MESIAQLQTPLASRYLTQLCKHFEHKLPVTHGGGTGRISFSIGDCALRAEEGTLNLAVNAEDEDSLAQLRNVVERHLVRFAFREELKLDWQPAS
jgi:hypothetical protein